MDVEELKQLLKDYIAANYVEDSHRKGHEIGVRSKEMFSAALTPEINFFGCAITFGNEKSFLSDVLKKKIDKAGKPFDEYLRKLMNKKGITSSDIYDSNTGIDRQYLNKILNNKIKPSKQKLFALMIAMKLNIDEALDLLNYTGFTFSENEVSDLVIRFCIEQGQFDVFIINELLDDNNEPPLT